MVKISKIPLDDPMFKWFADASSVADQLPFALPDIASNGNSKFTFESCVASCKKCGNESLPEDYRAEITEDGRDLLILGLFYCETCRVFNRSGVRAFMDEKRGLMLQPIDSWPMPWENDGPEQ